MKRRKLLLRLVQLRFLHGLYLENNKKMETEDDRSVANSLIVIYGT